MILTGLLTALTVWCLFYKTVDPAALGAACVLSGAALGLLGRRRHGGALSIDVFARRSRLNGVNPALKTWGCLALLVIGAGSGARVGLTLAVLMLLLNLFGGMRLREYLSLLALPVNFLLLSGLAILFEWSGRPAGVLNVGLFGGWLTVGAAARARAVLALSRALGAVSCLYLLSLSTPLCEIIAVLRRARVPAVVSDLMYLIHRYLFILLKLHATMRDAAESRLGFRDFPHSLRSAGLLYTQLLIRSFQKASAGFDAMESRCYQGEIRFLSREKPLAAGHLLAAAAILALVLAVAVWERGS